MQTIINIQSIIKSRKIVGPTENWVRARCMNYPEYFLYWNETSCSYIIVWFFIN